MQKNLTNSNHGNIVTISTDKKAVTTSLSVAAVFKKRHNNVVRDIENICKNSALVNVLNFEHIEYKDSRNRIQRMFTMDRTGFVLLAMGFTGDKALEFKIKYIQAFDAMEAELMKQRENTPIITHEPNIKIFDEMFDRKFAAIAKKFDQKMDALNYGVSCLKQSLDSMSKAQQADWKEIATGWKNMYSNATEFIEMMKGA